MRLQPKTVWHHPKIGRIEKSGPWFVAYDTANKKLGAKKSKRESLKTYFGVEPL